MNKVKVYQIGVGDFGRFGFEKLVDMHNHLDELEVELKGVAEEDFEKLEAAEKFAEANGIEIEKFSSSDELYKAASRESGTVLVYDAGPSQSHADHVYESLQRGLFHLSEKPPSMTREEHIKERKLASDEEVFWKADFIERESPVVKKALEMVEGKDIESIEVYRESPTGIQKALEPGKRSGIQGGDILDKMVHEIYVLDFLEASGNEMALDLVNSSSRFQVPHRPDSEKLMDIYGGYTEEIGEEVATGMTRTVFSSGDVSVKLNSSWTGLSREARKTAEKVKQLTGHLPVKAETKKSGRNALEAEEARFFIIKGEVDLLGDMLQGRLFNLESGEEIETLDLMHDQLYRVIEKAVRKAAGEDTGTVTGKEIDVFMNAVFDAREKAVENMGDFMDELASATQRLREKSYLAQPFVEDPHEVVP